MTPLKLLSFALLVLETSLASPVKHESPIAPLHVPDVETRHLLNDSYIVMFKDDIPPSVFAMHLSFVGFAEAAHPLLAGDIGDVVSGLEHVYDSVVAKGYAGRFSPGVLEMIRGRPEVKFVEQDVRTYANDVQNGAPWGLARINHRNKLTPRNMHYVYPSYSGSGVMVYVLDTGVYIHHREFDGRARSGKTFVAHEKDKDLNGHGTHVAGIIASHLYGVAKKAQITSVKVLDKDGHGTASMSIAGIQWAVLDAQRLARQYYNFKGAVINLSSGGGGVVLSEIEAVNKAVRAGVHVVVSAGNDDSDACTQSPAAADLAITVAASTVNDTRAEYSNYGECVDIFAPGDSVLSTGVDGPDASSTRSGTIMAAPHITGLIAHFLSGQNTRYFNSGHNRELSVTSGSYSSRLYAAVIGYLSEFASIALSDPAYSLSQGGESSGDEVLGPNGISPSIMKDTLRSLSSKGKLASHSLPAGTPNLLGYSDYSHIC